MSRKPTRSTPVIALLPLDERPACAALPVQVAAVAGVDVRTPPPASMPALRTAGDADGLGDWLERASSDADAAVVSLETLGHGGLIASRTDGIDAARALHRWSPVRRIAAHGVPVHAVTLVTRTPDSADAMEEPDYWDPHGPGLHRLSAALHRAQESAQTCPVERADARAGVPDAVRADFLGRRLRNHTLNLAALGLAAEGVLDTLVIGADDTAPWGLATAELTELRRWSERLEMAGRVSVRPGADEATTTLVARTLGRLLGGGPVSVRVEAVDPEGLARVAPYENLPLGVTVDGQIAACGARVTDSTGADLRLLVHTPDGAGDWAVAPPAHRAPDAVARARTVAERAVELLDTGHAVAVADCAQPNGADPLLAEALVDVGAAHRLTAYAGWNTAGNTVGTALAHGTTAVMARRAGTFDEAAHRALLAHRFTEDWGYMTRVRASARACLNSVLGRHDHVPDGHPVLDAIAEQLGEHLASLPEFGLAVDPASVRLPWRRTFEVDFRLTPAAVSAAHRDVRDTHRTGESKEQR
ncbi:DUF4127 family protein [Streptomyces sp. Q6]|uniref:DUF4127 family protein n=1 Tax=Streptomyces citrinus TaxID=3118173 RepID=A0ACD5A583_9ACTN